MSSLTTVLEFMKRINERNPKRLAELMTEDHVFHDAVGHSVRGREAMFSAWGKYYAFCPDYWVSHERMLEGGEAVAVFGSAGGTISGSGGELAAENAWKIDAAWLAVVEEGRVKEWRVYADNKPVYD